MRTGRAAHHTTGRHALGFVSNSVCSDYFQTSEILSSGLFQTGEMPSHVPACAGPEPCMRFAALSARYLLGITHLSSLNHPCHTGRIASNTNDKLDVSSSPVRARLADANSSSTHLLWHPTSSAPVLVRAVEVACLIACHTSTLHPSRAH